MNNSASQTTLERTALFLMANLGSEVSRILSMKEKEEYDLAQEALGRAESILVELSKLPEMFPRLPELHLLTQAIVDSSQTNPVLAISPKNLKSYFQPFALRLMATT